MRVILEQVPATSLAHRSPLFRGGFQHLLHGGDDIITVGGIHGRVMSTTEHDVTIDIGAGVEMRIARRAVAEKATEDDAE